MAVLPVQLARVSNLLRSNVAGQQISRTQADLLRVQNEISTGKRITVGSDDPGDAAIVQQLQKTLEQRKAFADNISQAQSHLSEVDVSLGDLTRLLQEAQTIASANVGSDVSADQRANAAVVVQSIYSRAVDLGNKQFNGTFLFGGDRATTEPFVITEGGVKFVGSETVLQNQVDENTHSPFMIDGSEVFGALSTRVKGSVDLAPRASAGTRLADLVGAQDNGVQRGSITLGNGTVSAVVDLSGADTIGDVADAINAAGVGSITASIGAGGGLVLSAGAGDNITVTEIGGGTTAADLGILTPTGGGAGVAVNGTNLSARVTPLTLLSDLRGGLGIDTTNGLIISNGATTTTVSFTSPPLRTPARVEDLLNAINNAGSDVRATINEAGNGIDILNPNQGAQISIAENGGTTAADLGVRSMSAATPLSELNNGKGVQTADGDDISITRTDGTSFTVDLSNLATIQDVIAAINDADTVGGTLPAKVTASFAATGNGIVLTDTAAGAGALSLAAMNFSEAAKDLGLDAAPASATVINGSDVNPVAAQGLFANLAALRDALASNDQSAITESAAGIEADQQRVVRMQGATGAKVQELESRGQRLEEQNLASQALLSELADTNFTEAIARFQTLQTALQAALQSSSRTMNLSLLDFLA